MRPPGAPDIPGAPGFLGGGGGLPGVGGGGMHVGPDDPLFAGRMGVGRGRGGGLMPPGARWDPIGPPGMPARALSSVWLGTPVAGAFLAHCTCPPRFNAAVRHILHGV